MGRVPPCAMVSTGLSPHLCPLPVGTYRSCPIVGCSVTLAYCKDHGGDKRAVDEIVAHVKTHPRCEGCGEIVREATRYCSRACWAEKELTA